MQTRLGDLLFCFLSNGVPICQDVVQPGPLARTLSQQMLNDPGFIPQVCTV